MPDVPAAFGIAAGAALLAAVLAGSLVAQDRSVERATVRVPAEDRTVRLVWGGIASGRIALAGFSQGGTIALHVGLRYPQTLAGVAALSTLLAGGAALESELNEANSGIPIFQAHGLYDPVIPLAVKK